MRRLPLLVLSFIKDILQNHNCSICFGLALLIAVVLSVHTVITPVYPLEDGQGYAMRGFALYGYLHTGQWDRFWNLLSHPNQSVCPLHYLLFFIVPPAWTGVASYVTAQNFTTYLLLAFAVRKLTQALHRPEWSPALFLLCAVNNFALADYGAFYLDMEFLALGLAVIAWQVSAWGDKNERTSFLCGVGLGLLFLMKPANTFVFLGTLAISEIGHAAEALYSHQPETRRRVRALNLLRHWGSQGLGFIPVLGLALICGGAQTILQLINNNEVQGEAYPVEATFLLRLFYFPLCLAFYYHALLLAGLVVVAFLVSRWIPGHKKTSAPPSFPSHLFIPVALAFLVFGELFSFWMVVKPVRSLILTLPLMGIALSWLAEKRRIANEWVFLIVAVYASLAFLQKTSNLLHGVGPGHESTYQLGMSSWTEMPSPWMRDGTMSTLICDLTTKNPPPPGIICANYPSIEKKLSWRLNAEALLRGETPAYETRYIFNYKGEYFDQALVGANLVIFSTYLPSHNYSLIQPESIGIINYGIGEWCNKGLAHLTVMPAIEKEPIGYSFYFPKPLTQAQVDRANESLPFTEMVSLKGNGTEPLEGKHYSRAEAWQLLKAWLDKRL